MPPINLFTMLHRKSLLALLALFSLSLAACGSKDEETTPQDDDTTHEEEVVEVEAAATPEGFVAYSDDKGAFTIAHPSEWTIQEDYFGTNVMFMSPLTDGDTFQENFSVLSQDLPAGTPDLSGYEDMVTEQLKAYITDFELVSSEDVEMGDLTGQKLSYKGTQGESAIAWVQAYTIKNDVVYVLTFTAEQGQEEGFMADVDQMIETFRVL